MNFKKVLALVLVLSMLLSMIPTYAFADFDELYDEVAVEEEAPAEVYDEWLEEEEGPAEEPAEEPAAEEPAAEELDEEPAAEEPAAEPAAEPADAANDVQGLEAGETLDLSEAEEPVAQGTGNPYFNLQLAVDQETGINLLKNVQISELSITHDLTLTGTTTANTITGNIKINAQGGKVTFINLKVVGNITLENGELVIDDDKCAVSNGSIIVSGGKLSISNGHFETATVLDASAVGNTKGGYFSNIPNYLCAEGYGFDGTQVKSMTLTAQIHEGIDRIRFATFTDAVKSPAASAGIILLADAQYEFKKVETLKINPNTHTFTPSAAVGYYYTTATDGNYTVYTSHHYVATVDGDYYKTIEEAVAVAGSTKEIVLLENQTYQLNAGDELKVNANGFTFTAKVPEGYTLLKKTESGITTYAVTTPLRVTAAPPSPTPWAWKTSGTGYLADQLDAAVTDALNNKTTNKILVAVTGSYEVTLAKGQTLYVKELDGTVKVKAVDGVYLKPNGTLGENDVKQYTGIGYKAKVVKDGNTKYYTTGYAAITAANKTGGTASFLDQPGNAEYVMLPDIGKSLVVDWGEYDPSIEIKAPNSYFRRTADAGTVTTYWLVGAVASIGDGDGTKYYETFSKAVEEGVATNTDVIRLLANIEEPYTVNPEVKSEFKVNHNGFTVTINPPVGYGLFVDGELYTPATRRPIITSGTHTYKIQKAYTVTFDPDNGKEPWTETVYDAGVTKPADPEKPGYTFDGWYNGDTEFEKWDKELEGDLNLKAKWKAITYVLYSYSYYDYEKATATDLLNTIDVEFGRVITAPKKAPQAAPPVPGTSFQGWALWNPNNLWINDIPGFDPVSFSFELNEDIIKYAAKGTGADAEKEVIKIVGVWARDKHTVVFDGNGGEFRNSETYELVPSITNADIEVGAEIAYPATNPERTGYTFKNWLFKGAATSTDALPKTMPAEDQQYVAQWKADEYTIDYSGTSLKTDLPAKYTIEDLPIVIPARSYEGWTFLGWTCSELGINTPEQSIEIPEGTLKNLNFVAKWSQDEYNLIVNKNGGEYATDTNVPRTYKVDSKPITIPAVKREGYDFNGWTGTGLTTAVEEITIPTGSTGDREYIANWTVKPVTVYIDYDGDGKNDTYYNTTFDKQIDAPTLPTIEGKTFNYWKAKLGDKETTASFPITLTKYVATVTITGEWDINKYNVFFNLNGGEFATETSLVKEYKYGATINVDEWTEVKREGYHFLGWTQSDGSGIPATMPANSFEVMANWEALPVFVIINDGVNKIQVIETKFTDPIVAPELPEYEGHNSQGWYALRGNVGIDEATNKPGMTVIPYLTQTMDNFAEAIDAALKEKLNPGMHVTPQMLQSIIGGMSYEELKAITNFGEFDDALDKMAFEMHATFPFTLKHYHTFVYLHADWEIDTNDLTFYANDGVFVEEDGSTRTFIPFKDVPFGTDTDAPQYKVADPVREGYEFTGWTLADGTAMPETMPAHDVDVYANWAVLPVYVIVNYNDGGAHKATLTKYDFGAEIAEPTPYDFPGYTFNGWYALRGNVGKSAEGSALPGATTVVPYLNEAIDSFIKDMNAALENPVDLGIPLSFATLTDIVKVDITNTYDVLKIFDAHATFPINLSSYHNFVLISADWTREQYPISYELDGGKFVDGETANYPSYNVEDGPFTIAQPVKTGNTFVGWTGTDLTEPTKVVTIAKGSTGAREYTANWELNVHTLTLDADGGHFFNGDEKVISSVPYGTEFATETWGVPEREGYTFVAWTAGEGKPFPTSMPDEDVTLKAVWEVRRHTLTLNANGGVIRDTGKPAFITDAAFGETLNIANWPVTVREGYQFLGWFNADGSELPATMPDKDVEAFAFWSVRPVYVVTNYNDGSKYDLDKVDFGEPINEPAAREFEGHTFNGWYALRFNIYEQTTGHTGMTVNPYVSELMDGHIEALLDAMHDEFKDGISVTMGQIEAILAKVERSEGIEIAADKLAAMPFDMHATFPINLQNYHTVVYLYADWSVNEHSITFNANGGAWTDGETVKVAEPVDFATSTDAYKPKEAPTFDGYVFNGWVLEDDNKMPEKMPDEDVIVYADWTPSAVKVTFNRGNDAARIINPVSGLPIEEASYTINAHFGDSVPDMVDVVWPDHEYIWVEKTYGINPLPDTIPAGGLEFTAKWIGVSSTVYFNANGGKINDMHNDRVDGFYLTGTVDEAIFPNSHTFDAAREGYTWHSWSVDGEHIDSLPTNFPAVDTEYVALWDVNKWNVTFTGGGAKIQDPATLDMVSGYTVNGVAYGDTVGYPPLPELPGYTFNGWYEDVDGFNTVETMPDRNLKFVASWTANEITVTFDGNGGLIKGLHNGDFVPSYSVTGHVGEALTFPVASKAEGYTGHAWTDAEGTHLDPLPTVFPAEDTTYTLVWDVNVHSITFDANSGTVIRPFSGGEAGSYTEAGIAYGSEIEMPENPTRTGYIFQGWYEDNYYGFNYPNEMPDRDLKFIAQWEEQVHTITLDANGGRFVNDMGVVSDTYFVSGKYNESVTYPQDPELEGYTLKAWADENGEKVSSRIFNIPAEDVTYYAVWEINEIEVTYRPRGGVAINPVTLLEETQDFTVKYKFGDELILPQIDREGYDFAGWADTQYGWVIPETVPDVTSKKMTINAFWAGQDFMVSFDANGGTVDTKALHVNAATTSQKDTVAYYAVVGTPDDDLTALLPISGSEKKEGYVFHSWVDEEGTHYSNNTLIAQMTKFPTQDLHLVADWRIETFTATFDPNNGTVVRPFSGGETSSAYDETVTFNETIPMPTDIARPGYTFQGWYEDSWFGYNYPAEMPARDLHFTAQWTADEHTITYETDGGIIATADGLRVWDLPYVITAVTDFDLKNADPSLYPLQPTKEGYTFQYWLGSDENTYQQGPNTMPAEDLVLTAIWKINTVTVTYVPNGGTAINPKTYWPTEQNFDITYNYGDELILPQITREGYLFGGWVENTKYGWNYPTTIADEQPASLKFTAVWVGADYTVTFDGNGGTMQTIALRGNSDSNTPDTVGYYTIVGKVEDSITGLLPRTVPTKDGYTFQYWVDEDGAHWSNDSLKKMSDPEGFFPAENKTFVAEWKVNHYTVTFNSGDNSAVLINPNTGLAVTNQTYNQEVNFGETIPFPADPTRPGHTFIGWTEAALGYNYPREMPAKALTFTAKWQVNEITYTFDANGGDMSTNALDGASHYDSVSLYSTTGNYNTTVKDPQIMAKEGYSFHGWVDQNGKHYNWKDAATTTFGTEDMTFTAEWEIESYEVKFDGMGGDLINPNTGVLAPGQEYTEKVVFGETIPFPADPVREGYTFNGWNATLGAQTYPAATAQFVGYNYPREMPARNITFTAQWAIDKHTITLDANGGLFKDSIGLVSETYEIIEDYDTSLTNLWPADPVLEGYKLVGWEGSDGKSYYAPKVSITKMPAEDLTLTAVWEIQKYSVTFDTNKIGAVVYDPASGLVSPHTTYITFDVTYGEEIPYPEAEFEGHEFLGWIEQTYGYNLPETMPGKSLTFIALWSGIDYSVTFDGNGGIIATKALDVAPDSTTHIDYVPSYTVVGDLDNANALADLLPLTADASNFYPLRVGYTFHGWIDEEGTHYTTAELPQAFEAKNKVFTAEWVANPHTITFNANGGTVVSTLTFATVTSYTANITFGDEIVYPDDPVRVGYQFNGWYETQKPYGFNLPSTMPDADLVLYAQWAPIANTVVYDANGGTVLNKAAEPVEVLTIEAKTGESIYVPTVRPERYGYAFSAWLDSKDNWVAPGSTVATMPALGETYTARWEAVDVTVNFYFGFGASAPYHTETVKFNELIAPPVDPVYEGHTFEGWYTFDETHGAQHYLDLYDFSAPVDTIGPINLVGKWSANTYTVYYNANGGKVQGPDHYWVDAFEMTNVYGTNIYVPDSWPVREGFNFIGWLNEDTQTIETNILPQKMPGKDTFFTAIWQAKSFIVTFGGNGGHWNMLDGSTSTIISQNVLFGDPIPVPAEPVYDGYVFVGWDIEIPETMPAENILVKAMWQTRTYTVHFDINGGMNTIPDQIVEHGAKATEPRSVSLYRNGYTFDHWAVRNANGTLGATWNFNWPVESDLELVAIWVGKEVTLRWADRNVHVKTVTVRVGDFIVRPEYEDYYFQQLAKDGRREGYRLDPEHLWYPEPPETVEESLNGMMYTLNWIKQIQIIFLDENSNVIKTMYVDENSTLAQNPDAPAPAKEGYNLLWTINGKTIDENTPITAEGPVTMKATYVEKPEEQTWTVTFNSDGGTEVKTQTIVDGETAAAPVDPVKDGYKFIGWTLDGETYDFKTPVTANITLTAVYEEIPYVVGRYALQLDNSFAINYYVDDLREGTNPADYTVSFNGGDEYTLTSSKRNEFKNVARVFANELLKEVSVVVKYKGEVVYEDAASVRGYCDKVFAKYGHDHDVQLVLICEAALNYGSKAQQFARDTGRLANDGEWFVAPGVDVPEGYEYESGSATGITAGRSALTMGSTISLNLYAQHGRKALKSNYSFLVDGVRIDNSNVTDANNLYGVVIPDIFVTALNVEHTLTVIYHEGQSDQETFSYTISPIAYMYKANTTSSDQVMRELAYYLYNYFAATTSTDVV